MLLNYVNYCHQKDTRRNFMRKALIAMISFLVMWGGWLLYSAKKSRRGSQETKEPKDS